MAVSNFMKQKTQATTGTTCCKYLSPKVTDKNEEAVEAVEEEEVVPLSKTGSSRFRQMHESQLMYKVDDKWSDKKMDNSERKDKIKLILRRIAMEDMTKEWMSKDSVTMEHRAYMVDKVFPTLVLGVEKLLAEVDNKKLVNKSEPDNNFNPLNYLAQYLMRNNPAYSNFSEASPYMHGLRQVSEQLRMQLMDYTGHKLAQIKMEARHRRLDREHGEMLHKLEMQRRTQALIDQFILWNGGKKIALVFIQNVLMSFSEIVKRLPADLQPKAAYSEPLEGADDTAKGVYKADFVEYLTSFILTMSNDMFNLFIEHMTKSAQDYQDLLASNKRKDILFDLFTSLDRAEVGNLDRKLVLELFASFYATLPEKTQALMRNPRKWPLLEINESRKIRFDEKVKDEASDIVCELFEAQFNPAEPPEDVIDEMNKPDWSEPFDLNYVKDDENEAIEEDLSVPSIDMFAVGINEQLERRRLADEEDDDEAYHLDCLHGTICLAIIHSLSPDLYIGNFSSAASFDSMEPIMVKVAGASSKMLDQGFSEYKGQGKRDSWLGTQLTRTASLQSIFDGSTLNVNQFCQIVETFLGNQVSDWKLFNQLIVYVREGYKESKEEIVLKELTSQIAKEEQSHKNKLNRLFDMWDNNGSGYLDMNFVENEISNYHLQEMRKIVGQASCSVREKLNIVDETFSKHEFRAFMLQLAEYCRDKYVYEKLVEYLLSNPKKSYAEQIKGEERKKLLQQIVVAAETGAARMDPVYSLLFFVLNQDADVNGEGKVLSCSISLLETNIIQPHRGKYMLRYMSGTSDLKHITSGTLKFIDDEEGVSFTAIKTGLPIHIPNIKTHGGKIDFWDSTKEDGDGSVVIIPIKDKKKRVFGLLTIDTLREQNSVCPDMERTSLSGKQKPMIRLDEIQFYQGVAKAFSIAYHMVNLLQKMLFVFESALQWIPQRCQSIHQVNVYYVENDRTLKDFVLRLMMSTQSQKKIKIYANPPLLLRKNNLYQEYLFRCVDVSELVTGWSFKEHNVSVPVREENGQVFAVVQLNIGDNKFLSAPQQNELLRLLRLLQLAYKEVLFESLYGKRRVTLKSDEGQTDGASEIMFERLILMDLRNDIYLLDLRAYSVLNCLRSVPKSIFLACKVAISLIRPDLEENHILSDWSSCRPFLNSSLNEKMAEFDPTDPIHDHLNMDNFTLYIFEVPRNTVVRNGLLVPVFLYDWASVCISLIEKARKIRQMSYFY